MKRLALFALLLAGAAAARAEVSVETWGNGHFRWFHRGSHVVNGRIVYWDQNGGPSKDDYLNLQGDLDGDLAPVAVVLPGQVLQDDPTPLVVWAKSGSAGMDIVYSVWLRGHGWTTPTPIGWESDTDDVEPRLLLDSHSRVHLVWWSNTATPMVVYSRFDHGLWTDPSVVSPQDVDARSPKFVLSGLDLYINYENWTSKPVRIESFLKQHLDP